MDRINSYKAALKRKKLEPQLSITNAIDGSCTRFDLATALQEIENIELSIELAQRDILQTIHNTKNICI